jgi:type II secretory pathway component PulF
MPNYSYQGLDRLGKQVTGQISADDSKTALMQVKTLGIFPTEVKPARQGASKSRRLVPVKKIGRVSSGDLTIFSRQLANLVKGGLPLMRTFSALTEHTENPSFKIVLERMQQEIKGGKALWEALESYPAIFPPLYVSMVKAGEASGQLSSVLVWLAGYLEKEQAQKNQIRSALAYPALLMVVGSLTIISLIIFIVPKFISMFQEFGQALPMPTIILVGVSGFLLHWWWALLIFGFAVVSGAKAYGRTPAGHLNYDILRLRLPLLGKLNLKSAVSRFARTTATLLQGGVTLFDSMAIVREVVGNEVLARGADHVRDGMREGQSFAARLKESGVFPPLLTHMAAVGQETGDLQGVLLTVADAYDVEVEATLKSVISLIEPIIIVIIGSLIAFIILAMLLPVFEINMMG